MRLGLWPILLSGAISWLIVPSPVNAEGRSPFRFRLEAGPSFDRSEKMYGDRTGYAFAGGCELGRKLGLIVSIGYERYGGKITPHLVQPGQGGLPPTVSVEGDASMAAISSGLGLRFGAPLGALDGFVEGTVGGFTTRRRGERWVDP